MQNAKCRRTGIPHTYMPDGNQEQEQGQTVENFGSHPNQGFEKKEFCAIEMDECSNEAPAEVENPEALFSRAFSFFDAEISAYLPGQTCLNRLKSAERFCPFEVSSTIKALISAVQAFNSSRNSLAGSLDSI